MSTPSLSRETRNALRSAVINSPGWKEWRAIHMTRPDGTLRDASQITTPELLSAAAWLGLDVPAIANAADTASTETAPKETAPMTASTASTASTNATGLEGRNVDDVIREALAPAEGMVGQKLLDMLAATVAPLAAAAVTGPRTIIKTVTVKAPGADGAAGPGAARLVNMTGTVDARSAFSIKASEAGDWRTVLDGEVSLWDGTSADGVPDRDPHHAWDVEALAYLVLAAKHADAGAALRNMSRVLMYGPAGTGKTSTAAQFAAVTGRPFVRIAFDRSTEAAELVGQRMPKAGGGTEYREGALVTAMQVPGCVILLDEPSFLRPGAAAVLQTILDQGRVYLKEDGNRAVDLAPGVVICAADNTNLTGDETGRYADTMAQNIALQDRFAYLVPLDYLPEAREADVLVKRTGVNDAAARAMVHFATMTRKGAATGQFTAGCSLRRLIAWAGACVTGVPSAAAFKAAIFNAADAADREAIRGLEKNAVDHALINSHVTGMPLPAAPSRAAPADMSAKASAAASVFGAAPVNA